MRAALLLLLMLCGTAVNAFASGCDISVTACPGVAGSSHDAGTLDCAGGATLSLLVTFRPAEAMTDLVAADCIIDFCVQGDVTGPASFWDMETANASALNISGARPSTGCSNHLNAFGVANSGSAIAARRLTESMVRIATTSYRPSNLRVALNTRVFAASILIDLGTSMEASGSGQSGCTMPNAITLEQVIPGSANNNPVTTLDYGSETYQSQFVYVNSAFITVPAQRHSWGSLKALYR